MKTVDELLSVALAIVGGEAELFSEAERSAVSGVRPCSDPEVVRLTLEAIQSGEDPLGKAFCAIRSARARRTLGQTLTPYPMVDSMLACASEDAKELGDFTLVVDPGSGTGRFLIRAAERFPNARLIGIELDPVCAILLRANLEAHGLSERSTVLVQDYRSGSLPETPGRRLFVGNPPYVRHHDIAEPWKEWYARESSRHGYRGASRLAGLHVHFFVHTAHLGRPGDLGVFVTAAEWLDTRYGRALRSLLCGNLGGVSVHVIDAKAEPFPGVLTTAAITVFRPGTPSKAIRLCDVGGVAGLGRLEGGLEIPVPRLQDAPRWAEQTLRPAPVPLRPRTRVGDLFRVSRGQVTGCNAVWVAGNHASELPSRFLLPCITGAEEIFDALASGGQLNDLSHLRSVVDLPKDLSGLDPSERDPVLRFLEWARENKADQTYIARHRNPWWAVRLLPPAPIICTYMARRPPAFVRNDAGARLLNIAHGLHPRFPLTQMELDEICEVLNKAGCAGSGRVYAGGLAKFEPSAVEEIPLNWSPRRPEAPLWWAAVG